MNPVLRLWWSLVVACAIGRAATAAPAVVLESYAGARPSDADQVLKPIYAELARRGFVLGPKLVTILGETMSRGGAALSPEQALDAQRLVEDGYQHFIDGDYDAAIALEERALAIYRSASAPNADALRKLQWKALVVTARSHEVLRRGEDAFRVMAEAIRTFPDNAVSSTEFDPQVVALQRRVKAELARQGTGTLDVRVDAPDVVVFVNERFAGTGGAKLEGLLPGRYRVFSSKGERQGRVHEVEVAPASHASVEIAWEIDSTLVTRDRYVGLEFGPDVDTEGEIRAGVRIARTVGAKSVVILGIREVDGRRSVVAYAVATDSQNKVYGAVQLEPIEPGVDRLTKLAALMAGDRSTSTDGIITREPARRASVGGQRWYHDWLGWTGLGVGLIAAGVGGGFLAHAASLDDQAARETNFTARAGLRDRASTQRTTGLVLAGAGGAVVVAAIVKLALVPHVSPSRVAWRVLPGPGDTGLALSFDF